MTAADLDLARFVRPGDTVLIGQSTGEPRSLVEALIAQRHELGPVTVFVGSSYTGLLTPEHADALRFVGFGAVGRTGALVQAGVVDMHPVHFGALPGLITSGRIPVDVVLAQVSAQAPDGSHSLGLVADYVAPAIGVARTTLAEINPSVPYTFGDTVIPAARLAAVVVDDRPLIEVERRAPLPEDEIIAARIAELIPDGATIQFGIGGTPDAVLAGLHGRRDLGVHSGILSDAFVDLVDAGVVTNARKEIDTGVSVTGALLGTVRLYDWARDNRALSMRSAAYTHDGTVLAGLGSLHAINSAVEVDLTGQINGESAAGRYVGLVGGQGAFARAALMSPSGRSIVALPSTARGGTVSRIVARLGDGIVSTARADADLVVTEHGVADLRGATLAERARRLATIADPRRPRRAGRRRRRPRRRRALTAPDVPGFRGRVGRVGRAGRPAFVGVLGALPAIGGSGRAGRQGWSRCAPGWRRRGGLLAPTGHAAPPGSAVTPLRHDRRMVISCDDCVMQHSAACADCVVTHVLGAERGVELDVAAERVVRLLVDAGLVPSSRHRVAC